MSDFTNMDSTVNASQDGVQAAAPAAVARRGFAGLSLLIVALWMLMHPFRNIEHDSLIYTLFALARLFPDSLGHDFFVHYGAQDRFTIFTPLYAGAIHMLGMEAAAAVLTLLTQAAFYTCLWLLARRFMPPRQALLALGLVVVMPAFYGSGRVFAYIEGFLTPRQPAEVFALFGIAAALANRHRAAAALMVASALFHPIVAAAGFGAWLMLSPVLRHPKPVALGIACAVALLFLLSFVWPVGPLAHFDDSWLSVLHGRLKYLFPSEWTTEDWTKAIAPLITLAVGAVRIAAPEPRRLCMATVATVTLALAIGFVGSDWIHIAGIAQLQTWRCLWLSGLLSVLLLPLIVGDCWNSGAIGRAAGALIIMAWAGGTEPISLLPAAAAGCCAVASLRPQEPRFTRSILLAAGGIAAADAIVLVLDGLDFLQSLQFPTSTLSHSHYALRIASLRVLSDSGLIPAGLLVLVWWSIRQVSRRGGVLLAVLGATACLLLLPYSLSAWAQTRHPPERLAAFEPWRAVIPPTAEVLWPGDTPEEDWISLRRASYWSLLQMAGMVFSRQDMDIGIRREAAVADLKHSLDMFQSVSDPGTTASQAPAGPKVLEKLCEVPDLDFIASWNYLGPTPYAPVVPHIGTPNKAMYLYRCIHGHR